MVIAKNKSVKVSEREIKKLKKLREKYGSNTEFSTAVGIDRVTLYRLMLVGTAHQDTVETVREYLKSN